MAGIASWGLGDKIPRGFGVFGVGGGAGGSFDRRWRAWLDLLAFGENRE